MRAASPAPNTGLRADRAFLGPGGVVKNHPPRRRRSISSVRRLVEFGLTLSAEKTKQTAFREGCAFLGFTLSPWAVTLRPKSVEKFKTKIRELTQRCHNLYHEVVAKVNRVVRGTANYFASAFSRVASRLRDLDGWLRLRLRALKFQRDRKSVV